MRIICLKERKATACMFKDIKKTCNATLYTTIFLP